MNETVELKLKTVGPRATTVQYGLLVGGRLLGYYTTSNAGADCCGDTQYTLDTHGTTWLVDEVAVAKKAASTSTDWYNADHDTPTNPYAGHCKVAVVRMTVQELEGD